MDITDDSRIDRDRNSEQLAKRIEWYLKQRGFCVVFEEEVERCWPSDRMKPSERLNQIEAFAESHGWKASIRNTDIGGTRVIFAVHS